MQRRAVAVFVALFLAVAGVAGALTATADSPEIALENPEFDVSMNDTVDVDGNSYTVADISESENDDGQMVISGVLEREFSAEASEAWGNDSTVTVDDRDWRVVIEGDEPSEFTLVEELDRQAILEEDDAADNETYERDGEEYVGVTDENGEATLVPADEYFPAPEERSYAVDDTFEYDDRTVTVGNVTAAEAELVWETTETETVEIEQESTVTIGDTEYIAHFPDASTLTLSTDIEAYEAQVTEIERHDRYNDGLSRVMIFSVLTSIALAGLAFIPSRY